MRRRNRWGKNGKGQAGSGWGEENRKGLEPERMGEKVEKTHGPDGWGKKGGKAHGQKAVYGGGEGWKKDKPQNG